MRNIFVFFFLLFIYKTNAQVSISPFFPSETQEITINVDLTKVKDGRAASLLNKTDDIYLWAWAGSSDDRSKVDIGIAAQSSFNTPFSPGKMTLISKDIWQIKFKPKDYYKSDKAIKWIGFLVKNGNGSGQTEDFTQTIYSSDLRVAFFEPKSSSILVENNQEINLLARSSEKANLAFALDGFEFAKESDMDSIKKTYKIPENLVGKHEISVSAITSVSKVLEKLSIYVSPIIVEKKYLQPLKNGVNYFQNGTIVLAFTAPLKKFVHLIGEFNNWELNDQYLMNKNGNQFWYELPNMPSQKEIAYQYLVEGALAVADPFSEQILDPNNDSKISAQTFPNLKTYPAGAKGIVSTFEVNQAEFNWSKVLFSKPKPEHLVIYELLVRDFSSNGNFKAVIDSIPYFKKLGINCLELMPIMEFTGNDSWGYNPTFYTAVDKAYGTRNDLKTLIDLCHQNGIAVILDMVLNQADYEFPYVKMYFDGSTPSANSPYFNVSATHPYSVFFDFNHESSFTIDLVKQVNEFWLKEFHFDGFRFDLSKGFTQTNSGINVGLWGSYDKKRIETWKKINADIKKIDTTAYVILEHFADRGEESELASNGMMLWGNEHGAFENIISGFTSSLNGLSYKNRQMSTPGLIYYMESHDEERLAVKAAKDGLSSGNYAIKDVKTFLERSKAAAALLMLSPGPKMIWQFGEFGYDVSINQNGRTGKKPQKWEFLKDLDRLKLMKVYGELGKKISSFEFLNTKEFELRESSNLKQWYFNGTEKALIVANLTLEVKDINLEYPQTGDYFDFFTGEKTTISNKNTFQRLQPGEFHVYSQKQYLISEKNLVPWAAFTAGVSILSTELEQTNFDVYPNPASDFITIKIQNTNQRLSNVAIFNQSGVIMQESVIETKELKKGIVVDISSFPAGVYHVKINNENKNSKKIVKN